MGLPVRLHASSNAGTTVEGTRGWSDRKSTRLNSSHSQISYAVFCLKKKSTLPGLIKGQVTDAPTVSSVARRGERFPWLPVAFAAIRRRIVRRDQAHACGDVSRYLGD